MEYFLIAVAAGIAAITLFANLGSLQNSWDSEVDDAVNQINSGGGGTGGTPMGATP